jgi:hypothetical protein
MKMKNLVSKAIVLCLFTLFSLNGAYAAHADHPAKGINKSEPVPQEVQVLINRVEEIKAMDFSTLTSAEKKNLKKELRTIKSELKVVTGVYLSIGAIIIIILLLLLLL